MKSWFKGSVRPLLGVALCASMLVGLPGATQLASAASPKQTLKIALTFPRSQKLAVRTKQYNQRLADLTDGQVQFRIYWGGAAGDERAVLRKMRTGQIDGSPFSLEVMSNFVREALVLASPGLFLNYKQVDAVRAEMTPAFNDEAYKNGFKVLGWGDVGRLRLFSKNKFGSPYDLRRLRPWLFKESDMLRELYKMIGATGVPLGLEEVYGAMETGMIDTFWATAVLAGALQWHRTAKYIAGQGMGFVSGAFALRREAWDAMPQTGRDAINVMVKEQAREGQIDIRKDDEKAYRKLLKRGYTPLTATSEQLDEWWDVGHKLRKRMIGRIYTKQLVEKAEAIAMKYADKDQKARFAKSH